MYSVSTSFIKRYQALHMFSGHPYCLEFKIHQIHIWYIRLHLSQNKNQPQDTNTYRYAVNTIK